LCCIDRLSRLLYWDLRQTARFDAHFDKAGISLSLYREGGSDTRKSVRMHFHYALFAEILRDLARTAASVPLVDVVHREALADGAKALSSALESAAGKNKDKNDITQLTPEEEVLLLHVME
jgi:hypothetical protein